MATMRLQNLLATVCLITVAGCAAATPTAPTTGPTAEEAAANRAEPYREGKTALSEYAATTPCDGAHAAAVERSIGELEGMVEDFHAVRISNYEETARQRHVELAFDYASTALDKGCLDAADDTYRRLISFYVGSAYSGIRDRARIGIDDVRAARRR